MKIKVCQAYNSNFWHKGLEIAYYLARFFKPKIIKFCEVEMLIYPGTGRGGTNREVGIIEQVDSHLFL